MNFELQIFNYQILSFLQRLWTHIKHKYENTPQLIHQHDEKNTSDLEKASNKDAKKD